MPKDKKPLPKPPKTPFGHKGRESDESDGSLVADKMSIAMAKGEMDSFIKEEFDGNANAAKLASMMMGMTGMSPGFMPPGETAPTTTAELKPETDDSKAEQVQPEEGISGITPPEDIMKAVMSGNVKELTGLLKKAAGHQDTGSAEKAGKDTKGSMPQEQAKTQKQSQGQPQELSPGQGMDIPFMEKELLVKLIKMAEANEVSVDWLMQRALKLYIRDHENTGRM